VYGSFDASPGVYAPYELAAFDNFSGRGTAGRYCHGARGVLGPYVGALGAHATPTEAAVRRWTHRGVTKMRARIVGEVRRGAKGLMGGFSSLGNEVTSIHPQCREDSDSEPSSLSSSDSSLDSSSSGSFSSSSARGPSAARGRQGSRRGRRGRNGSGSTSGGGRTRAAIAERVRDVLERSVPVPEGKRAHDPVDPRHPAAAVFGDVPTTAIALQTTPPGSALIAASAMPVDSLAISGNGAGLGLGKDGTAPRGGEPPTGARGGRAAANRAAEILAADDRRSSAKQFVSDARAAAVRPHNRSRSRSRSRSRNGSRNRSGHPRESRGSVRRRGALAVLLVDGEAVWSQVVARRDRRGFAYEAWVWLQPGSHVDLAVFSLDEPDPARSPTRGLARVDLDRPRQPRETYTFTARVTTHAALNAALVAASGFVERVRSTLSLGPIARDAMPGEFDIRDIIRRCTDTGAARECAEMAREAWIVAGDKVGGAMGAGFF
jgi:hypothetical protein